MNHVRITINKATKKITCQHERVPVVASSEKELVYEIGGRFCTLKRKKDPYAKYDTVLGKASVHENKWNSRYIDDELVAYCYSFHSQKITTNTVKKALFAFIQRESYFYNNLIPQIEKSIKESL